MRAIAGFPPCWACRTRRRDNLPEGIHQRVRVKAALEDVSMQTLVAEIVTKAVADVVLPRIKESERRV